MSREMPGLPPPSLTEVSTPYWQGAGRGKLLVQRCDGCGSHRHPPTTACYRCQSQSYSWDEIEGNGAVYSYIWADRPVTEDFEHLGLYNVSVVELDGTEGEPVRIVARVNGVDKETLEVGLPVEVDFDPLDDGGGDDEPIALPVFVPRAPTA